MPHSRHSFVKVLKRDDMPTFKCFALEAVYKTKASSAIPYLVPLLKDSYEIPPGCVGPRETEFPIRKGAASTLRQFGVIVTEAGHRQYTVDQESLKKAQKSAAQPAAQIQSEGAPSD